MHILFETKEKPAAKKIAKYLPDNTTLVQSNKSGTPYYRFRVTGGKMELEVDFKENDRNWRKGEREKFETDLTKKKVLEFFLTSRLDESVPQREYSAMSDAEYTFFKYIRHAGSNVLIDNMNYPVFRISLNDDADLKESEKEIKWVLGKIAKVQTYDEPIYISIFEHTLSKYGTYYVFWDHKNTFRLMTSVYHREDELKVFKSLHNLLEYIRVNHWYESKTKNDWE